MKKKTSGFTLIEMLLYTGLLSIFLLVLTQIFTSSLDTGLESQATSSVAQDTRFIYARLAYDIENSDSITSPGAIGEESSILTLTRDGQTFTYSVSSGALSLTDSASTEVLNSFATETSSLNFRRLGNLDGKNNIEATFTLKSKTTRGTTQEEKTLRTTIGTR